MDAKMLNYALNLALEWGENFHKPIQARLLAAYPAISPSDADALEILCREIINYAFEQVERAYLKEITAEQATANITARYPRLSEDIMSQMWAQGQYYAWHDNG